MIWRTLPLITGVGRKQVSKFFLHFLELWRNDDLTVPLVLIIFVIVLVVILGRVEGGVLFH